MLVRLHTGTCCQPSPWVRCAFLFKRYLALSNAQPDSSNLDLPFFTILFCFWPLRGQWGIHERNSYECSTLFCLFQFYWWNILWLALHLHALFLLWKSLHQLFFLRLASMFRASRQKLAFYFLPLTSFLHLMVYHLVGLSHGRLDFF